MWDGGCVHPMSTTKRAIHVGTHMSIYSGRRNTGHDSKAHIQELPTAVDYNLRHRPLTTQSIKSGSPTLNHRILQQSDLVFSAPKSYPRDQPFPADRNITISYCPNTVFHSRMLHNRSIVSFQLPFNGDSPQVPSHRHSPKVHNNMTQLYTNE